MGYILPAKKYFSIQGVKNIKLGIIGSGIGGSSCAHFLNSLFNDEYKIEIDVYEKSDIIGGRLATFNYDNREYETGGSILHPSNYYMENFTKICGLFKK